LLGLSDIGTHTLSQMGRGRWVGDGGTGEGRVVNLSLCLW